MQALVSIPPSFFCCHLICPSMRWNPSPLGFLAFRSPPSKVPFDPLESFPPSKSRQLFLGHVFPFPPVTGGLLLLFSNIAGYPASLIGSSSPFLRGDRFPFQNLSLLQSPFFQRSFRWLTCSHLVLSRSFAGFRVKSPRPVRLSVSPLCS